MISSLLTERPPNLILSALPDDEYQKLLPYLKEVAFRRGEVIYSDSSAKYVHFLNRGAGSVCLSGKDGDNLELCMIGTEGLIGVRSICLHDRFDTRCEMVSNGNGSKLPVEVFQKLFFECRTLAGFALLQLETRTLETALTALCSQSHSIEKRFIRWLLTAVDRLGSDQLAATQEMISCKLNVQRPSISVAFTKLQGKGLLGGSRGQIKILDRTALERETCGCYFSAQEIQNNYRAEVLKLKNL